VSAADEQAMASVLGGWQIIGVRAEHDPSCNGDCRDRCPIPVQYEVTAKEAAAALTKAGYGLVADAKAEALREAADDGPLHFAATHTGRAARGWNVVEAAWLRDRAARIEHEAP
jgi:hypothetical protein